MTPMQGPERRTDLPHALGFQKRVSQLLLLLVTIASGVRCTSDDVSEPAPDTTPPSVIRIFARQVSRPRTIRIDWIAPGDDLDAGQAMYYDLRTSDEPWKLATEGGFLASRRIVIPPPSAAGRVDSTIIVNAEADRTVYFALRAHDDWGNAGPISNVVSAQAVGYPYRHEYSFGRFGPGLGEFANPRAIDWLYGLYVLDIGKRMVFQFREDSIYTHSYSVPDSLDDSDDRWHLDLGSGGNDGIFILDHLCHVSWLRANSPDHSWTANPCPYNVAVDEGHVYLLGGNRTIRKYTGDGQLVTSWMVYGQVDAEFIEVGWDGAVYVGGGGLAKYSKDGTLLALFPRPFHYGEAIDVSPEGNLFAGRNVPYENRYTVTEADPTGRVIATLSKRGRLRDIAVADRVVWVLEDSAIAFFRRQ